MSAHWYVRVSPSDRGSQRSNTLGARVAGRCEPLDVDAGNQTLEEQHTLLTTEPFLLPPGLAYR